MSKKRQEAAENNLNNGVNSLQELQDTHTDVIAGMIAEIKETEDQAVKILKLRELRKYIDLAVDDVGRTMSDISSRHAIEYRTLPRKLRDNFFTADPYTLTERYKHYKAKVMSVLEKQAGTKAFFDGLDVLRDNAAQTLVETVRNCDLQKISGSPYFTDAFKLHAPLRDRFEAAAAARAALGDQARASEEKQADKEAPAVEDAAAASSRRKTKSYDHLRIDSPKK